MDAVTPLPRGGKGSRTVPKIATTRRCESIRRSRRPDIHVPPRAARCASRRRGRFSLGPYPPASKQAKWAPREDLPCAVPDTRGPAGRSSSQIWAVFCAPFFIAAARFPNAAAGLLHATGWLFHVAASLLEAAACCVTCPPGRARWRSEESALGPNDPGLRSEGHGPRNRCFLGGGAGSVQGAPDGRGAANP